MTATTDTQISVTADGRIRVGDRVTVTTEWAARLVAVVYPGRTVAEIRSERAGRVLEIWAGGLESEPWTVVRIDSAAAHPWELAQCLELAPGCPSYLREVRAL